jgi:hypothetical protein
MYTPNRHQTALQEITQILTKKLNLVAIYCFGCKRSSQNNYNVLFPEKAVKKKTLHFHLLVFTDGIPNNAVADISNIIRDELGNVSVTLLLHTTLSFKKAFGNQQYFFWKVSALGSLFYYSDSKSLGKGMPLLLHQDVPHSEKYWYDRRAIAKSLLEAESGTDREEVSALCQSMLHTAVSQICLGLIELFLGYRPNHFALGYLFDICSMFTSLPDDIFPRSTEENKRLFNILSTHMSMLRHSHRDHFSTTDMDILAARCVRFLEKATELAEAHIKKVESENIKV